MEKSSLIPVCSSDLSISKFDQESFYIHQTKFDYRLKISQESHDLLLLANGINTLEDIKNLLNDNEVDIDFLEDFYFKNLSKYGIIENKNIDVKSIGKPSYLKLSFIVLPAQVVDLITPYLKFLFIPKLMYSFLCLIFIFLSFISFQYYNTLISYDLTQINWIYFSLLGFISVTFHEFGHASSAKYFGAKHGGIGGGFYLFTPVYFADVSDIWKLSRYQRIIVNLSGIYFESIMSCFYIVIGLIANIEMFILIGIILSFHSLWNFNPFLRNDGYWVLSDGLNYPNLSKNSLLLLRYFVTSFFKKNIFSYSLKNIFLIIYAFINQSFVFIFLYYSINNYGLDLFTFPYDLVIFIKNVIKNITEFNLKNIMRFFIPFLFYFILINYLKSLILIIVNRNKFCKSKQCMK
jgi:putative peptide zinc metalloprotease protein